MNVTTSTYRIFKALGVPTHVLGYIYLQDAVALAYDDPDILHNMTKGLYPTVAEKHGTTGSRVERAMRHAIEFVFDNTDYDIIQKYFGNVCSLHKGKLTNSQFIAGLVQFIKMEGLA